MGFSQQERRTMTMLWLSPAFIFMALYGVQVGRGYFKTQALIQAISALDDNESQRAIQAGANVNARTSDGGSMVMWAIGNNGNLAMVRMLKAAGATTDPTENLFIAAIQGDPQAAQAALAAGADVNRVEKDGWTPLIWAACCAKPAVVKVLLAAGANRSMKGHDGQTALTVACEDVAPTVIAGCGPGAAPGARCPAPPVCVELDRLLKGQGN